MSEKAEKIIYFVQKDERCCIKRDNSYKIPWKSKNLFNKCKKYDKVCFMKKSKNKEQENRGWKEKLIISTRCFFSGA